MSPPCPDESVLVLPERVLLHSLLARGVVDRRPREHHEREQPGKRRGEGRGERGWHGERGGEESGDGSRGGMGRRGEEGGRRDTTTGKQAADTENTEGTVSMEITSVLALHRILFCQLQPRCVLPSASLLRCVYVPSNEYVRHSRYDHLHVDVDLLVESIVDDLIDRARRAVCGDDAVLGIGEPVAGEAGRAGDTTELH